MLISPDHHWVISNLGWADKSALWIYDAFKDSATTVQLGEAKYLSIYPGREPGQFAVLHHSDGASIRLTIHSFDDPARALCTAVHSGRGTLVEGDPALLTNAPRYYVAYYNPGHDADCYLIRVDADRQQLQTDRLEWYDSSYDKDYQGIVGVTELASGNLVVSIQRDSHPVLYDPTSRQVMRKLTLAGRGGNPRIRLAKHGREVWADDYDTLLRLDVDTLKVQGVRRLQSPWQSSSQFIGDWSFNEEESLCFVARPFSGDVLALSTETLRTKYVAKMGRQPLEAVLLKDGKLIARDWKTGDLLTGSLRRSWFA